MGRLLPKTLTGREQSTFSVWSSPSWIRRRLLMAKDGAGRIAALKRCVDLNSGRVCPLARRHFAPKMRVGRGVGITASGQKTPIFVAYRRLERGASRYRSLSPPSGVSSISIACGLEDICCTINLRVLHQRYLSEFSRPLAASRDRDIQ